MREFKRISVEKGQAYIRDTGITASEVVSSYLTEKDMQAIFQRYPAVETDDILEALGYAVQDTHSTISFMGSEMRVPLTSIEGFTALLTKMPQNTFSDDKRLEFIKTIQKNVVRLKNFFVDILDWNNLYYRASHDIWEKYHLNEAIDSTNRLIESYWPDAIINGRIPADLPTIKSNFPLPSLLFKLAGDNLFGFLKHEVTWREITSDKGYVFITIERPFAREEATFAEIEGFLSWSISPLALAAEMLKKHGSTLELISGNESVIFKFGLPIWNTNI